MEMKKVPGMRSALKKCEFLFNLIHHNPNLKFRMSFHTAVVDDLLEMTMVFDIMYITIVNDDTLNHTDICFSIMIHISIVIIIRQNHIIIMILL